MKIRRHEFLSLGTSEAKFKNGQLLGGNYVYILQILILCALFQFLHGVIQKIYNEWSMWGSESTTGRET